MMPTRKKPFLGVLMLDTQFPRILGDAGNPASFSCPVKIITVKNADSTDVVNENCLPTQLCQQFIDAAITLQKAGASAIISTCGFLITEQEKISAAVDIPVMVSALSLYKKIKQDIGNRKVLIITASKTAFGPSLLKAANIAAEDIHIMGMEKCAAFASAFLQSKKKQSLVLDSMEISDFIIKELESLIHMHSDIGAILLECGNLPPYIDVISSTTGLPVYSIFDGVQWLMTER